MALVIESISTNVLKTSDIEGELLSSALRSPASVRCVLQCGDCREETMRREALLLLCLAAPAVVRAECVAGNCAEGQGEMRYDDGSRYVGEWRQGQRSGRGIHYRANGGVLNGEWQEDRPKGYGTYRFTNRARYAAEWTGTGRAGLEPDAWSVGGVYIGQHDGREDGEGTVMYADGATYIGGYRQGRKQGRGTMVYPSGAKYFGDWNDGRPEGSGLFVLPDGRVYVGSFRAGWPDGPGRLIAPDGQRIEGVWRSGALQRASGP